MGEEADKRALLQIHHDCLMAVHPGVARTLQALQKDYWWLGVKHFVQSYVKGCLRCQESKVNTYPNMPPLQPIAPEIDAKPFTTIAMDFIIKLPTSNRCDSILTITDHDCTKAVILFPCWEEIDSLKVAKLYLERVFPFVGLLKKVISDRDPRFTLRVFKEICVLLKIKQRVASVYHPQIDGQSEKNKLACGDHLVHF